ncbi:MAG: hypothetical protein L0J38_08470, partial [Corynebacterium casei]|nr:hypothetical protein [Corynebacterium casei]
SAERPFRAAGRVLDTWLDPYISSPWDSAERLSQEFLGLGISGQISECTPSQTADSLFALNRAIKNFDQDTQKDALPALLPSCYDLFHQR